MLKERVKRILVADDHPIVRQGLRDIVAQEPDMEVGAEAVTGPEVIEKARAEAFDIVVLDLSMPGIGGLEVLRQLKEEKPNLPVIILSMHAEDQYAERVLKLGAAGYINKESSPKELGRALRKVLSGGTYVSPRLAEHLAVNLGPRGKRHAHEMLSDREFDVMIRIGSGQSTGEIAEKLNLSVKTISTYRARILQKMGLRSNAQLIAYAIREHLVE